MLEAALQYAGRGWAVFPRRADKHPITAHGIYDATTDTAVIREWWTRWPWASIGITTGTKIDVLDIDVRPMANGFEALAGLPALPSTLIASTPSGGWHVYFQHIVGSRTRKFGRGLEWISIGPPPHSAPGNVVAPPGPGREWINQDEIAEAPEWLRELVLAPRPNGIADAERGASSYQQTTSDTRNMMLRSRAILRVVEEAEIDHRTPALFWAACRFGEIGIREAVGEAALMQSAALVGLVRDYGVERVRRQILNGMRIGRLEEARWAGQVRRTER
jgi:putative DNA primase/helicase